jgi:hypothetical protein
VCYVIGEVVLLSVAAYTLEWHDGAIDGLSGKMSCASLRMFLVVGTSVSNWKPSLKASVWSQCHLYLQFREA